MHRVDFALCGGRPLLPESSTAGRLRRNPVRLILTVPPQLQPLTVILLCAFLPAPRPPRGAFMKASWRRDDREGVPKRVPELPGSFGKETGGPVRRRNAPPWSAAGRR